MAFRINFRRPQIHEEPSSVDKELDEIRIFEEKLRLKKEKLEKEKREQAERERVERERVERERVERELIRERTERERAERERELRVRSERDRSDEQESSKLRELREREEKLRRLEEELERKKAEIETEKKKEERELYHLEEEKSHELEQRLKSEESTQMIRGEKGEKGDRGERGYPGYTVSNYLVYRKFEQPRSLVTVICEDINHLKYIDMVCKGKGDVVFYFPTGHSLTQNVDVKDYTIYKLDLSGMVFPKLHSSQLVHVMCTPSSVSEGETPNCLEFMMIKVVTHPTYTDD